MDNYWEKHRILPDTILTRGTMVDVKLADGREVLGEVHMADTFEVWVFFGGDEVSLTRFARSRVRESDMRVLNYGGMHE